jgi:hypothetical protein
MMGEPVRARLRIATQEPRLFLGYALTVFRPGSMPPQHPQKPPTIPDVPQWSDEECSLYIAEARRDMDSQQADKRDVRSRAQIILTTSFVLGAATTADATGQASTQWWVSPLYVLAFVLNATAGLAAAGIITAKSEVGAPSLQHMISTPAGELLREVVRGYAASRHRGSATVAALVTVLRDSVLILILAFLTLTGTHALVAHVSPPEVQCPSQTQAAT